MCCPYLRMCVLFVVVLVGSCAKSDPSATQRDQVNNSGNDDRKNRRERREEASETKQNEVAKNLAKLNDEDRKLAEAQRDCPIGKTLGAMGVPVKMTVKGKSFFICCEHCKEAVENKPDETLEKVAHLLNREYLAAVPREAPNEASTASNVAAENKEDKKAEDEKEEADIKKNLAKLSDADRKLALEQKMCPIDSDARLGSMGVPIKLMLKGKPVFICCKGCKEDAEKKPEETLAKVAELVKKNKKK